MERMEATILPQKAILHILLEHFAHDYTIVTATQI